MIVSMIAAMGKNRVIGKDNDMMWRLPKEWKHFKETTTGHCIIMGRKNIEAQGRALPNRTNIVLTRSQDLTFDGCVVVNSLEAAFAYCKEKGEEEAFICGGGQIYELALPLADKIYLTVVDYEEEGEVYFPEFDASKFSREELKSCSKSEDNQYAWTAYLYTRKN